MEGRSQRVTRFLAEKLVIESAMLSDYGRSNPSAETASIDESQDPHVRVRIHADHQRPATRAHNTG